MDAGVLAGRRRWVVVAAAALAGPVVWTPVAHAVTDTVPAAAPVTVTVDATHPTAFVPGTGIGMNASTYDGNLTDAAVPGLLRDAGVRLIRFPGGTESDEYDWKTNTDVLSHATEAVDFDQFMTVANQTGAQPMITVDYGTGDTIGRSRTPAETGAQVAADWVYYANVLHHDHIRYWEIGNEVYGNGTYGADWEPDEHCATGVSQPSNCGPAVYAHNVEAYAKAMKAVDPTISIGVVLTMPGNWPDGVTAPGSPQPWNQTVLPIVAPDIGFADVHWYPQNPSSVTPPGPSDAGLLASTDKIPSMTATLRSELAQYTGKAGLPIAVTETNSVSSNPGKQTVSLVNALYLNQDYLGWLGNGVSTVDWWQTHNGIVTSGDNGPGLYGNADYGDYGVLSNGSCGTTASGTQVCEPPADTPFPAYRALTVLSRFIHPGDQLLTTTSSQSTVRAYAARGRDGVVRVLLVDDDPATSYAVHIDYTGYRPCPRTPTEYVLAGSGATVTVEHQGSATDQTIAPYSLVLIEPAH